MCGYPLNMEKKHAYREVNKHKWYDYIGKKKQAVSNSAGLYTGISI